MKSRLGLVNYLRDHIREESIIAAPLNQALLGYNRKQKNHRVAWNDSMEVAWSTLKQRVNECPKLFWVDDTRFIHLYTDASNIGMGAYLCQVKDDGKTYPIGFMSMTFNETQRRWHTVEQEAYAIVKALEKFEYLLRDVHFTLHTDHKNLVYIRETGSKKVLSWKLAIQEYSFDIVHVKGEDNPIADYFSRNLKAKECQDRYLEEDRVVPEVGSQDRGSTSQREFSEGDNLQASYCNALREDFVIPDREYKLISAAHSVHTGHTGV